MLRLIYSRVFCYQKTNTNEPEELTKFKIRTFDYFSGLHQNDFIEKSFGQEEDKFCEVSQDTD